MKITNRFYNFLLLSISIVIVFVFIALFNLNLNGNRFIQEFYSQNHQNIESGNSFALITQLNSLSRQDVIICIVAQTNGQIFYNTKNNCKKSIFTKDISVKSKGKNTIIDFEYSLSETFYVYLFISLTIILLAANSILLLVFRLQDIEKKSIARINELSRQVAHDIRSPLSALNLLASKMKDTNREYSELIAVVVQNINNIADDLLRQSRSKDTNPKVLPFVDGTCNLNSALKEAIQEKEFECEYKSISIEIKIIENKVLDDLCIAISKTDFSRMISNILNNSIEAFKQNNSIHIRVIDAKDSIVLTITDFGHGIPESILRRLLKERLSYRKDTNTTSSGHGIGLYAAHQILSKVGGNISIDSKVGVGTKISLSIPKKI